MSDDDLWHPRTVPPSGEQVPGPTDPTVPPSPQPSSAPPPFVPPSTPPSTPTYIPPPPVGPAYPGPAFPGPAPFGVAGPYAPMGPAGYAQPHGSASTSMTLGIVSLVCAVLAPFCWIPVLGAFAGPFAIAQAMKAKREMRGRPGAFTNEGQATAGLVTGIIGTVLGVLEVIGIIVLVIVIINDPHS